MDNKLHIKIIEGFSNYKSGQRIHFNNGKILIGKSKECHLRIIDKNCPDILGEIEMDSSGDWIITNLSNDVSIFLNNISIEYASLLEEDDITFGSSLASITVLKERDVIIKDVKEPSFSYLDPRVLNKIFSFSYSRKIIKKREESSAEIKPDKEAITVNDSRNVVIGGHIDTEGKVISGDKVQIIGQSNQNSNIPSPLINLNNVCFDSIYPSPFQLNQWQDLLVYCYNEAALEKVKIDLRKRMKEMSGTFNVASDKNKLPVPENAMLTIIPNIKDVICNPAQANVYMIEDYHCVPFRVQYQPQSPLVSVLERGEVRGSIKIFLEGVQIGEIPIEGIWGDPISPVSAGIMGFAQYTTQKVEQSTAYKHTAGYRYRKIFVSYSRKDAEIVERLEKAYKTIGDQVWRDLNSLKSGSKWEEEIKNAIAEADIFQLFWSENAQKSENVKKEWLTALALKKSDLIRPVYWNEPLGELPEELKQIAFTLFEI